MIHVVIFESTNWWVKMWHDRSICLGTLACSGMPSCIRNPHGVTGVTSFDKSQVFSLMSLDLFWLFISWSTESSLKRSKHNGIFKDQLGFTAYSRTNWVLWARFRCLLVSRILLENLFSFAHFPMFTHHTVSWFTRVQRSKFACVSRAHQVGEGQSPKGKDKSSKIIYFFKGAIYMLNL